MAAKKVSTESDEALTRQIGVRLSDKDYKRVESLAGAIGVSALVRDLRGPRRHREATRHLARREGEEVSAHPPTPPPGVPLTRDPVGAIPPRRTGRFPHVPTGYPNDEGQR